MALIETWFNQDLQSPVVVHHLHGNFFSQDNQGNLIGVNVFDGGEPATLSGTVTAYVIRADGATVPVTGSLNGNKCSVILSSDCYSIEGSLSVVIKLTGGGSVTTLCALVAYVYRSDTDTAVDPGTIIPSVEALIELIEQTVATIPSDYTDTVNGLTAKYGLNDQKSIVYDYYLKKITFPGGFYTYYGKSHAVANQQVLDISSVLSAGACNLYIDSSGVISAGAWNGNTPSGKELIGYVYDTVICIYGVPQRYIRVIDSHAGNSIYHGTPYSAGIIGVNHYDNVVYNYTTKVLTIPPAFTAYCGFGRGRGSALSLDVSSVLSSEACLIFVRESGSIYATRWSECRAESQTDQCVGYIFRKQVVLFGVNPDQISVIDESTDKVFCFGDSITAGVGASKLYHMDWHKMNPNLQFYNYGIGSTGYVLEWTGDVVAGGGVIGDGSTHTENGNNNVLKVMQSITGSMPNICIFAGTNDYGNNIPIADFRTAVQNALDYALTKTAKVFVIIPIKRENWATATNALGLHLKDYCDVIIEECDARGIVYGEGYDIGIDPSVSTNKTAFAPDGLHPNDAGHMRIARALLVKMQEAFAV